MLRFWHLLSGLFNKKPQAFDWRNIKYSLSLCYWSSSEPDWSSRFPVFLVQKHRSLPSKQCSFKTFTRAENVRKICIRKHFLLVLVCANPSNFSLLRALKSSSFQFYAINTFVSLLRSLKIQSTNEFSEQWKSFESQSRVKSCNSSIMKEWSKASKKLAPIGS